MDLKVTKNLNFSSNIQPRNQVEINNKRNIKNKTKETIKKTNNISIKFN